MPSTREVLVSSAIVAGGLWFVVQLGGGLLNQGARLSVTSQQSDEGITFTVGLARNAVGTLHVTGVSLDEVPLDGGEGVTAPRLHLDLLAGLNARLKEGLYLLPEDALQLGGYVAAGGSQHGPRRWLLTVEAARTFGVRDFGTLRWYATHVSGVGCRGD